VRAAVREELGDGLRKRATHVGSIVWVVDVASALADLTEISSQVEAAVVVDAQGAVLASTIPGEAGTERLAQAGLALLEAASARFGTSGRAVIELEAALRGGSIFVARDGGLGLVARTSAGPTSGLVLYDLRNCLRGVAEAEQKKPKPRSRKANKTETADA
jgi:predicted regulator of Ras-like GTPase activity (Roadblock/LC7/MglB family)